MVKEKILLLVSGGPDSMYLLDSFRGRKDAIVVHFNFGLRGKDSDLDQEYVCNAANNLGFEVISRDLDLLRRTEGKKKGWESGIEEKAREARNRSLKEIVSRLHPRSVMLAHTADDQVETVLMRMLEGAGIAGLKGIPRKTDDGVERPLLDTWRRDILEYLRRNGIPYRVDKSNYDTRFERNWIRHVLIPLLEKRYGRSVKKRIFALGERFREIDAFLDAAAVRWTKGHLLRGGKGGMRKRSARGPCMVALPRKAYSKLPGALGKRVLQRICFECFGVAPNERLLEAMAGMIRSGGGSRSLSVGKGVALGCGYEEAVFLRESGKTPRADSRPISGNRIRMDGPGRYGIPFGIPGKAVGATPRTSITWEETEGLDPARLKKATRGELAAVFDADRIPSFLTIRPLRKGDRIRPFGMGAEKKVKEILIDRKVPRHERWGRPSVCDAAGRILWIPGVVRSARWTVTAETGRTAILTFRGDGTGRSRVP